MKKAADPNAWHSSTLPQQQVRTRLNSLTLELQEQREALLARVAAIEDDLVAVKNDLSALDSALDVLSDVVDGKADIATTLAGYGITDAYTKAEVNTELAGKAASTHVHGNISNDGKVGSASGKPLITTTGGTVAAGSFGTSAGTVCEGNDSRLSDARTPTAHTHGWPDISITPTTLAGYGITDVKIENGVITIGSDTITPLTSHQDISGKADDSAVVHKSGAETITGVKTHTANINRQDTGYTKGTRPGSDRSRNLNFFDSGGTAATNRTGLLSNLSLTNGDTQTRMYAYKAASGSTSNAYIGVTIEEGGDKYGEAPTPASAADDSTKIATTEWVRDATGVTALSASDIAIGGDPTDLLSDRGFCAAKKIPTNTDLDDMDTAGVYWASGSNSYTNLPSGVGNGWLFVLTISGDTAVKQLFFRYGTIGTNDSNTYVRTRGGGNWSAWKRFAMV